MLTLSLCCTAWQVVGSPHAAAAGQPNSVPHRNAPQHGSNPAAAAASAKGAAVCGIVPGAGAAASSQLLSRVEDLLADAGSTHARLAGGGMGVGGLVPAAAEDDGICLDDVLQPEGSELDGLLPAQLTQQASAGTAALAASAPGDRQGVQSGEGEVGSEVWYEHQTRDAANQWVPHTPAGTSSSKDSLSCPPGWAWGGPWRLEEASLEGAGRAGADPIGSSSLVGWEGAWSYSEAPADAASSWSAACCDSSHWRRRRWQRQRVRTAAAGVSTDGGLQLRPQRSRLTEHGKEYKGFVDAAAAAAAGGGHDQGMVLLAVLLCTLLRGSKLQESKRGAIMLLTCAALRCDDEVRLQTVVPYLLTQLADPHAAVR